MLNMKKDRLSRIISLIAAFSVILTAFAGINASAAVNAVAGESFYEDFEGYGEVSFTTNFTAGQSYGEWQFVNVLGTSDKLSKVTWTAVDTAALPDTDSRKAGSTAINMGIEVTATSGPSIYKDPNITIGEEDIVVSGDIYIPSHTSTQGNTKYVRFYVSRGGSGAAEGQWPAYSPHVAPAFGLGFESTATTTWKVCAMVPSTGNHMNNKVWLNTDGAWISADRWYNIAYVYHPTTDDVDYYIDGVLRATLSDLGDYEVPTLEPGAALGSINVVAGNFENTETAVMFDNLSAVKVSAADEAKYAEIENGADYVFANWDVPVLESSINTANVSVKKMAANDVTFSGEGATNVTEYNVAYKGESGMGIKFNSPLTENYARYQVKVTGLKDIYGNENITRVHNFIIKDSIVEKVSYEEPFDSSLNGWTVENASKADLDWIAEKGGKNGVLKNEVLAAGSVIKAPEFNIPVNNTVEYVDMDFDLWFEKGENGTYYQTYFKLLNANDLDQTGLSIIHNRIQNLTYYKENAWSGVQGNDQGWYDGDYNSVHRNGQWNHYKYRYYPWQGTYDVYFSSNGAELPSTPLKSGNTVLGDKTTQFFWNSTTHGNKLKGFKTYSVKAGSFTYLDNFKVASYGYSQSGLYLKAATFENVDGKMLDNKTSAKKMTLHLANAAAAPAVLLNGSPVSGSFNSTNGTYTINLSEMLVGNTTNTINVNGTDYTFTTGDGEYLASNLRFEDDTDVVISGPLANGNVTPKVDIFNSTNETKTPYLILAAYNGDKLEYIDLTPLTIIPGYDDTSSGAALSVTDDHKEVKAFIWDGLTTLVELTEECALSKPVPTE